MLPHGAWHWAWGRLVRLWGERSRACCPTGRAGRPGLGVLRGLAQQAGRAESEGSSVPPMWPQRQALGGRAPPAGPARTARPPCPAPTRRPCDPLALLLSGGGVQTPASRPPVRGRGPPRGGTGRERRRRHTEKEKGPRAEERGTPRGWKRRDSPRNPRRETPASPHSSPFQTSDLRNSKGPDLCRGGTWSQWPPEKDTQHVTTLSGGPSRAMSHGVQLTELGARPLTPTVGSASPLGGWPLPGPLYKSHSPSPGPQAGPHCTQGPCSGPSPLGHPQWRGPPKSIGTLDKLQQKTALSGHHGSVGAPDWTKARGRLSPMPTPPSRDSTRPRAHPPRARQPGAQPPHRRCGPEAQHCVRAAAARPATTGQS